MTYAEVNKQVADMRKFREEISKSPEKIREMLHKTGMHDKNGTLKPRFR